METPNPWSLVVRAAGRTALIASSFPTVAFLVGGATRSFTEGLQIVQMGEILLVTSLAVLLIGTAASGRRGHEGWKWTGWTLASFVGQFLLALTIVFVWQALDSHEPRRAVRVGTPVGRERRPVKRR